ncbi:MAG TPA: hypothetical protein VE326_10140 [Candidatus Binatia bacterium]|nr:hypothetical protein [Candidatus Binatia bacterium]
MPVRSHVIAALLLLATALPAQAAAGVATKETALQRIQRSVARIDREASTPEGEARVVKQLAAQLAMPEDTLRARHDGWALGYGEIAMVYGFARASRRQSATLPDQIVEMRRDGQDWKAIAKQVGVSIDAVASRMRRNEPPRRVR